MKYYRKNKDDSILDIKLDDDYIIKCKNMNDIQTFIANNKEVNITFIKNTKRFTKSNIIEVEFKDNYPYDYIPYDFCKNCINLKEIINFPTNIKTIETFFMYKCYNFNSELNLSNIEIIKQYFLNCNFNSSTNKRWNLCKKINL